MKKPREIDEIMDSKPSLDGVDLDLIVKEPREKNIETMPTIRDAYKPRYKEYR
jgi:hypothetical protein